MSGGSGVVALVTCSRLPALTPDDRLLAEPLRRLGLEARPLAWNEQDADWRAFEAVVIRSTWDYHARPERFRRWIDDCDAAGVRLWNHPAVLRWNLHKRYLRDLEERGVPIVPTLWLERGADARLGELLGEAGWERAVVKPAISAGARRTSVVSRDGAAEAQDAFGALLERRDVLVQPFLPQVVEEGEWSFLFFGGEFSHAVLKRPLAGDFRVQERFGGSASAATPPRDLVRAAGRVITAVRDDLLYARVDAVRDGGRLLLVELEVLEPSLFLETAPEAPGRLAREIARRAGA